MAERSLFSTVNRLIRFAIGRKYLCQKCGLGRGLDFFSAVPFWTPATDVDQSESVNFVQFNGLTRSLGSFNRVLQRGKTFDSTNNSHTFFEGNESRVLTF